MRIPKTHPRYKSLRIREKLIKYWKEGLLAPQGLLAHGRGEAFDYLLGEKTIKQAKLAARSAASLLLLAERSVISVNGNTAALAAKDVVKLSNIINARIEVNLFHRSERRVKTIIKYLEKLGARNVLGRKPTVRIPGLSQPRALCTREGIFSSDVVLVAVEDGDRTEALTKLKKKVIAIDLNPLSRTAQTAQITIIDDVQRAMKELWEQAKKLKFLDRKKLERIVEQFDNNKNLKEVLLYITKRLETIKWY